MTKYVYMFDEYKNPNTEQAQFILGNKGAQLAEMTRAGLNVPYGFTITTDACREFYRLNKKWPKGLEEEVKKALKKLEKKTGKKFGDEKNPLFVSVRSGSYVSMPGMMDTVLNLGMNDKTTETFANLTKNPRAAYDSYRRFINMFGDVVMGIPHAKFEEKLTEIKERAGAKFDTDLNVEELKKVVEEYKAIVKREKGNSFPQDPITQLKMGINAVFDSWNSNRAIAYRKINNLRNDAGTAVNVQAMVFGNMGEDSGTGVAFTRNPATGEKEHYGEFLVNAQGEDVVAGIRTPKPIEEMKNTHPKVYAELSKIFEKLDKHYKDMQDFEFTFEKGKLYLLQTRSGKRTAHAAVKIAVDMAKEGLITKEEAIMRVKPEQLDQLLHKQIDMKVKESAKLIAKGIAASPGAAVGKAVFSAEKATELTSLGEKVILVRTETSPEDIEGMHSAKGILTARGGKTSHAAVVARGMGKPCVAGCEDIIVHEQEKMFKSKSGIEIKEGEYITIDGSTGEVFDGELMLTEPVMSEDFSTLMKWADQYRKLKVRTNADTPNDARIARNFGAEGIGLCRTEHMFFEGERIKAIREMIFSQTE
ncbi:MAG: pyruvate, phosphate dikinase, partial [Candidatus Diapherotrites archaeon]